MPSASATAPTLPVGASTITSRAGAESAAAGSAAPATRSVATTASAAPSATTIRTAAPNPTIQAPIRPPLPNCTGHLTPGQRPECDFAHRIVDTDVLVPVARIRACRDEHKPWRLPRWIPHELLHSPAPELRPPQYYAVDPDAPPAPVQPHSFDGVRRRYSLQLPVSRQRKRLRGAKVGVVVPTLGATRLGHGHLEGASLRSASGCERFGRN